MATTVVFVRHGKAQGMAEAASDYHRELTPDGLAALQAAYPDTFSRMADEPGDIVLWVSPAVRAKMTAEVIESVLDVEDVEEHESILYQDVEAVISELQEALFEKDDGAIICVGHVPSMEDLVYELSGNALDFGVGSAAALSLDPTRMGEGDRRKAGKLLWFVRGPEV